MSRIAGSSFGVALIAALVCGSALAATGASKDEAVAMVKKAVAYIKSEGPKTAYAAIDNQSGQFVDRDLYIVVYGMDGTVLAHGANKVADRHQPDRRQGPRWKAIRQRARHARRDAAELLAVL